MPAPAQHMATQCESTQVSAKPFSHKRHRYSEHASSLTLRQRCQRTAAFEVERLERCAVLDTCMSPGQNQSHQSIHTTDARRRNSLSGRDRSLVQLKRLNSWSAVQFPRPAKQFRISSISVMFLFYFRGMSAASVFGPQPEDRSLQASDHQTLQTCIMTHFQAAMSASRSS